MPQRPSREASAASRKCDGRTTRFETGSERFGTNQHRWRSARVTSGDDDVTNTDVTHTIPQTLASVFGGKPNLTLTERTAYIAVGLGLAAAGVKPRPNPLLNILALLGGSYLAWSGYTGHCPAKAALLDHNVSTPAHDRIADQGRSAPAAASQ